MDAILQTLARELERSPEHVQNVATLIDEGATIPFIARYRKKLPVPWTTPSCGICSIALPTCAPWKNARRKSVPPSKRLGP